MIIKAVSLSIYDKSSTMMPARLNHWK